MKIYLNFFILLFLTSCGTYYDIDNSNCNKKIIGTWKLYDYIAPFGIKRGPITNQTFLFRSNTIVVKSDTLSYSLHDDCSVLKLNINERGIRFLVHMGSNDTLGLIHRILPHEQSVLHLKRID